MLPPRMAPPMMVICLIDAGSSGRSLSAVAMLVSGPTARIWSAPGCRFAASHISSVAPPSAGPAPSFAPAAVQTLPASFDAMVELVRANGGGALLSHLTANARVVRYEAPELVLSTSRPLPADLPTTLAARLSELTGVKWKVTTEDAEGEATLAERRKADEEAERAAVMETPIVKAALETFPDAVLERINKEALG